MRAFLVIPLCLTFSWCNAYGATHIAGVVVSGRVGDISRKEIRDFVGEQSNRVDAAVEVRVINKNEIHLYSGPRETGWSLFRRTYLEGWGKGAQIPRLARTGYHWNISDENWSIFDRRDVLDLIEKSKEVYIFPIDTQKISKTRSLDHLRGRFRLLNPEARTKLVRLLSREKNWFHGSDHLIYMNWPDQNVGFSFRQGGHELILLHPYGSTVEGAIDSGRSVGGFLEESALNRLGEWESLYAREELLSHQN
jgi:hypothetical protein